MRLPLYIVDAFASGPFTGNPAAVVPLESWLPEAAMQDIAAQHNLSETAFVLAAPQDGLSLRWFTPTIEVPLCGHATLASAFVLAEQLGRPAPFRFETRSGPLGVARKGGRYVLDFPAVMPAPAAAPAGLAEALGAAPAAVFKGRDWLCLFDSAATVRGLRPDHARIAALPDAPPGETATQSARVIVTAPGDDGVHDSVSRYFAARIGIAEDPVTGAAHTQIVPFWAARLGKPSLVCHQASARGGTLWCTHRGDRVALGGTARLYAAGTIHL
jgi:PhzF family phenazine biosynthesis protein